MENGKIELESLDTNTASHPDDDQWITSETMFDCVWLVNYPNVNWKWNLNVFMHIIAATLEQGKGPPMKNTMHKSPPHDCAQAEVCSTKHVNCAKDVFLQYATQCQLVLGEAEIRNGPNSEADIISEFKDNNNANTKGLVALQSATGFYVRVRKPVRQGRFCFVYGVYEETEKKVTWPNTSKMSTLLI